MSKCLTASNVVLGGPHIEDDSTASAESNALELNRYALGQLLDRHTGSGRLVLAKILFVDRVHFGKVLHAGEEDGDLHTWNISIGDFATLPYPQGSHV